MIEPKTWWAIFPDYRDLSAGVLQDKPWAGGSNMTSDLKGIETYHYDTLQIEADKLAEALKFYADPESWVSSGSDGMHFDAITLDDTGPDNFGGSNRGDWVAGELARKTLKEYRGEK